MSLADVGIRGTGGLNAPPTDRWVVASGQTDLVEAGEPTKQNAAGDENVILLVDADLTVATDQPMAGVSVANSTETASAAGYVDVYTPGMWLLYEILALTTATADTQSEIDALIGDAYIIDLTSSAFTMDTAAPAATGAFIITGGDPDVSSVFFRIRLDAVRFGRAEV